MKHFLNKELLAPNVLTAAIDPAIPGSFLPLASADLDDRQYATISPPWASDIRWISASTPEAFERFQRAFDALKVAEHVAPFLDLESDVRLYAGFLVVRTDCSEPNFHVDWEQTNNEAFTLMTPVTASGREFGLLYKKLNGEVADYEYQVGEAIIFGDHFAHSTKPGHSDDPVVLLCFTFGTDKMKHWDRIFRTAGYQSRLVRRPDGAFAPLSPPEILVRS